MFFYVKTPSTDLVYGDTELAAFDGPKAAARRTFATALQTWLESNPSTKFSTLSGAKLIAWNAAKAALAGACAAEVVTHVVQQRWVAGVPVLVPLATATYVAMWDGRSANIITVFGTFPGSIPFMGWPQTDVFQDAVTPP